MSRDKSPRFVFIRRLGTTPRHGVPKEIIRGRPRNQTNWLPATKAGSSGSGFSFVDRRTIVFTLWNSTAAYCRSVFPALVSPCRLHINYAENGARCNAKYGYRFFYNCSPMLVIESVSYNWKRYCVVVKSIKAVKFKLYSYYSCKSAISELLTRHCPSNSQRRVFLVNHPGKRVPGFGRNFPFLRSFIYLSPSSSYLQYRISWNFSSNLFLKIWQGSSIEASMSSVPPFERNSLLALNLFRGSSNLPRSLITAAFESGTVHTWDDAREQRDSSRDPPYPLVLSHSLFVSFSSSVHTRQIFGARGSRQRVN